MAQNLEMAHSDDGQGRTTNMITKAMRTSDCSMSPIGVPYRHIRWHSRCFAINCLHLFPVRFLILVLALAATCHFSVV